MSSSRWSSLPDAPDGERYAARFARLAGRGIDVHGEASFCSQLVATGRRVLDAGCGTGRVAIRLAELGFECVGVDSDESMLAKARESIGVSWVRSDLAELDHARGVDGPFDLVVAAGNVMPLLAAGTERAVIAALAARLSPTGALVAGFGLEAAHLPLTQAPFGLPEYDQWCSEAQLQLDQRYSTWSGEPFDGGGYAVSVHRPGAETRHSGPAER